MSIYRGDTKLAGIVGKTYTTRQATLLANSWSNNEQTVSVIGVSTTNTIIVSPDPTNFSDYTDSVIYCSSQANGTLTFTCDSEPTNDIVVNIMIFN